MATELPRVLTDGSARWLAWANGKRDVKAQRKPAAANAVERKRMARLGRIGMGFGLFGRKKSWKARETLMMEGVSLSLSDL